MKKPVPKCVKPAFDYHECRDYLQKKYNYNERDYAGRYKAKIEEWDNLPYQDFWHFVIDAVEIHNGCFFTMSSDWICLCTEKWQRTILNYYLTEFGDKNNEIVFWCAW